MTPSRPFFNTASARDSLAQQKCSSTPPCASSAQTTSTPTPTSGPKLAPASPTVSSLALSRPPAVNSISLSLKSAVAPNPSEHQSWDLVPAQTALSRPLCTPPSMPAPGSAASFISSRTLKPASQASPCALAPPATSAPSSTHQTFQALRPVSTRSLRNTNNQHEKSPPVWRATSSRGSPFSNSPSTPAAACEPPKCANASIAKSSAAHASRIYSITNLPSSDSSLPSSWKPPMSWKPDAPPFPTHSNPKQPTNPHLQIQPLTLLQKKSCPTKNI